MVRPPDALDHRGQRGDARAWRPTTRSTPRSGASCTSPTAIILGLFVRRARSCAWPRSPIARATSSAAAGTSSTSWSSRRASCRACARTRRCCGSCGCCGSCARSRLLPDLRVLTVAVGRSIPGVASLAAITLLLVYVYGMIGWVIFHDHDPANFEDIGQSMVTMFVLLTLENLPVYIARGQELSDWTLLFFVSYVLAGVVPDLQPLHRDRHQLDGGGPCHRAAPRRARAPRRRHRRRRARARGRPRGAAAGAARRPSTSWSKTFARRAELWFTSSCAVPPDRAHRGPPRGRPRAHRARGARADRPRRLPRGAGGRRRRRGRRGHRHRLPPLPVQGRPLRRGLPPRLAARGRRHARRRARRPAGRRPAGSPPRSRPSRAARCAAGAWPGRCSPSPSTRPSRSSAWPSAAPTPRGFEDVLRDGVAAGELAPQNVELTAAALVGALGEALVGPLSPVADDVDADALVADLVAFCLRSVTEETV